MSGIQFVDFRLDSASRELSRLTPVAALPDVDPFSDAPAFETCPTDPETGELVGVLSGRRFEDTDSMDLEPRLGDVLAWFEGEWFPVPLLRQTSVGPDGVPRLDDGPTTWARGRLRRLEGRGEDEPDVHVALALDTELAPEGESAFDLLPSVEDSKIGQRFAVPHDPEGVARFARTRLGDAGERWVADWVRSIVRRRGEGQGRRLPRRRDAEPGDAPPPWWAEAYYALLIDVVRRGCELPAFGLIDVASSVLPSKPIDVDLVLDLGNSRSCGVLRERRDTDEPFQTVYPLEIRDLGEPSEVYADPFPSTVEFDRAVFGPENAGAACGREDAFDWGSFLRIGEEAVLLGSRTTGEHGSGMSSPKRYLWDDAPADQVWRFSSSAEDGTESPPVEGTLMNHVTEAGDVIAQLHPKPASTRLKDAREERGRMRAMRAKFSRSNVYVQMMAELLLHAFVQINSVDNRARRQRPGVLRVLRRVFVAVPPATPLPERRIMQEHVEGALILVRRILGLYPAPAWLNAAFCETPTAQTDWDEATCTQLVFLFAEIHERLREEPERYCDAVALHRRGDGPSLRIASIDIGGGTTDLMITTYRPAESKMLVPTQEFREGFRLAGDDILEQVIARHVLPGLARAAEERGAANARAIVDCWTSRNSGTRDEARRAVCRRFVQHVLMPTALALLARYESFDRHDDERDTELRIAVDAGRAPADVLARFDEDVAVAGGAGFAAAGVEIRADARDVERTIAAVIENVLRDFGEIVHRYRCDYLLVSGRPSRWPAIRDCLIAGGSVPPDRIVAMSDYPVGAWYPFGARGGRIADPKTTVAVGAMLACLLEYETPGLGVRTGELRMRSTAKYVGIMAANETILDKDVLLEDVDFDAGGEVEQTLREIRFENTRTIGFRQLPLERWTATPLYRLEYEDVSRADRLARPLSVTVRRGFRHADEDDDSVREDFEVAEVFDANGLALGRRTVRLRLRTMSSLRDGGNYWIDSGHVRSDV